MQMQFNDLLGFCQCGCGQPAKGRFVQGHNIRVSNPRKAGVLEVRDMGYSTPCHLWTGYTDEQGYGRTRRDGDRRARFVHRIYYEAKHGPLLPTLDLHHRCDIPACANPAHLVPIAHAEHNRHHATVAPRDALGRWTTAAAKTGVCAGCGRRFGYRDLTELDEDNHDGLTYFHGDRLCRECADNAGVCY